MPWEREQQVLAEHGVTNAEWAVLITAGYYVSLSHSRFIPHAVWEGNGGIRHGKLDRAAVAKALTSCLKKGWVAMTKKGHIERERNVLGEFTSETMVYPKDGVVLTEAGHDIHNQIAIGIYGRDYFST